MKNINWNQINNILTIAFIIGCASETQIIERDQLGGAAGENSSGSGNSYSAGSGGEAAINSGGTGNNAGANMGGEAGDISTGGNNNVGGSGGGPCIPKTCDTYSFEQTGKVGKACGTIPDDGCGNVLNCTENNNCGETWERCGSGTTIIHENDEIPYPMPNNDDFLDESITNPNICNGGCEIQNDYTARQAYCGGDLIGSFLVICPHGNWEIIENGPESKPIYFMNNNETIVFAHCDPVNNFQLWCCYN